MYTLIMTCCVLKLTFFGNKLMISIILIILYLVYLNLSGNLIHLTLHCESPSLLCVLFTLVYPTLFDTFYEKQPPAIGIQLGWYLKY